MLPMSDCFVEQVDGRQLSGYVENERTRRRPKRTKIFFDASFDREIEEIRAWRDGQFEPFNTAMAGPGIGIAARFSVKRGDVIQLKVAISYCGREQARLNRTSRTARLGLRRRSARGSLHLESMAGPHRGRGRDRRAEDQVLHRSLPRAQGPAPGQRRQRQLSRQHRRPAGRTPDPAGRRTDARCYDHHNSDAFWGAAWSLNLLWSLAWPEVDQQLLQHPGRHLSQRRPDPAWSLRRQLHLRHDQPDVDNLSGLRLDAGDPHLRHRNGLRGHAQEPWAGRTHGQGRL